MDIVFITDCHFKESSSVRTGSISQDLLAKLEYVVSYCMAHNCILTLGGDLFDRSIVSDSLKLSVAKVLSPLKGKVYSVTGNHCRLYGSDEHAYKTSYNLLAELGVFIDLDRIPGVDLGDFYLTGQKPIKSVGKPQLVIFHGFLNKDDGLNTFLLSDIESTDNICVCLGHDHIPYPLYETSNVRVIRPGSFIRDTRIPEHMRVPNLVHLHLSNGTFKFKLVPIKCRDSSEIFVNKIQSSASVKDINDLYGALISNLNKISYEEQSFYGVLSKVATPLIYNYIKSFDNE